MKTPKLKFDPNAMLKFDPNAMPHESKIDYHHFYPSHFLPVNYDTHVL
jgi:hypothetical protein